MTFDEVKDFVLPFGPFQGKTVDEIARTDEGSSYLMSWEAAWDASIAVCEAYIERYSTARDPDESACDDPRRRR